MPVSPWRGDRAARRSQRDPWRAPGHRGAARSRGGVRTSDDLYAYVQSLEPAVRDSDADAIWMVSRVYDYCSGYAMAPAAYARDTAGDRARWRMRGSAAMAAARQRVSQRCARFVPQDDLSPRMIVLKRVEAAEAGSLAAEAALLAAASRSRTAEEYTRDLVERVQAVEGSGSLLGAVAGAWASPPAASVN